MQSLVISTPSLADDLRGRGNVTSSISTYFKSHSPLRSLCWFPCPAPLFFWCCILNSTHLYCHGNRHNHLDNTLAILVSPIPLHSYLYNQHYHSPSYDVLGSRHNKLGNWCLHLCSIRCSLSSFLKLPLSRYNSDFVSLLIFLICITLLANSVINCIIIILFNSFWDCKFFESKKQIIGWCSVQYRREGICTHSRCAIRILNLFYLEEIS